MRTVKFVSPAASSNEIRIDSLIPLKDLYFIREINKDDPEPVEVKVAIRQLVDGYGIYLGGTSSSNNYIPEVVIDEEDNYTLIFKRKVK